MPVPWNSDDPRDLPKIAENLRHLLRWIVEAAPKRDLPSVAMARDWHRQIFRGVQVPVAAYVGGVRGRNDTPELVDYEVVVGQLRGVSSREVPTQLSRFETSMEMAVAKLDAVLPVGEKPVEQAMLQSVLTLCAHAHGEWARIHPFANGNGRVARLWANWCAVRYGLPPFVRLQPRPEGSSYAMAAADSMRGRHRTMLAVFADMLTRRLFEGPY